MIEKLVGKLPLIGMLPGANVDLGERFGVG
jgi:hypothetical protein